MDVAKVGASDATAIMYKTVVCKVSESHKVCKCSPSFYCSILEDHCPPGHVQCQGQEHHALARRVASQSERVAHERIENDEKGIFAKWRTDYIRA